MAKFQPWLKMWVEWVDDPKMLSLSLAEQGAWWRLCTLAKKCAADGFLVKGRGAPLSLNEIADAIRIKTRADRRVFDSMVEKMAAQGSLHWSSNVLVITHFAERQAKTASETPEAVRERVRLYRERQRVTENPLPEAVREDLLKDIIIWGPPIAGDTKPRQGNHTFVLLSLEPMAPFGFDFNESNLTILVADVIGKTLLTDFPPFPGHKAVESRFGHISGSAFLNWTTLFNHISNIPEMLQKCIILESTKDITKDIDTEAEAERNGVTSLQGNAKSVTAEATLAKISKLHEEFFGILTANLAEKFKFFSENYRGPVEWIDLAFAEAVKYKNRRWQYVEAILYSWQEKGGPHADRREPGDAGQRPGADQRDPLASYREQGWEILGEDEPEAGN